MKKEINWDIWVAFLIAVAIPAGIIASSNFDIFPGMRGKMFALLAITVGASLYTAFKADEPDKSLRQAGIIIHCALGFVLYLNVVSHMTFNRELISSEQSRQEQHVEEDRDLARAKELTALEIARQKAESERLAQVSRVLVQTPNKQKGTLAQRLFSSTPNPSQPAATAPTPPPVSTPATVALTPQEVRDWWNPVLMWLLMIEAGLSILGISAITWVRNWDSNGDGVPEWLNRIARQFTREEFAGVYPKYFAKYGPTLYPKNQ